VCKEAELDEDFAENIWNQMKGVVAILSNQSASLFENTTYIDKNNNTVYLEEKLEEIVKFMSNHSDSNLTTLFGESAENILEIFDNYTHDPDAGIEIFFQDGYENFTVDTFIALYDKILVQMDEMMSKLKENKIPQSIIDIFKSIHDAASINLNWVKEHKKVTFNDFYYLISEKQWNYSTSVRISGSTTLSEAFEFFPKNIINLKETWKNFGKLERFSLIDILLCFVADKETSSRRALNSIGHIFRNGIDKIIDIGPKFGDETVQLSDLGFKSITSNVTALVETVNDLTLSAIIKNIFNKDSAQLSKQLLVLTKDLRDGKLSIDNLSEIFKLIAELFIKTDSQDIGPESDESANVAAFLITAFSVAIIFTLLIIVSAIRRIKYSNDHSGKEYLEIASISLVSP
jgi:hypothetical protein